MIPDNSAGEMEGRRDSTTGRVRGPAEDVGGFCYMLLSTLASIVFYAGVHSVSCSPRVCSLWFEVGSVASLPALPSRSCPVSLGLVPWACYHYTSTQAQFSSHCLHGSLGGQSSAGSRPHWAGNTHAWALQPDRNPGPWLWLSATSDPRLVLGSLSLGW